MREPYDVLICGGGPVGLALALELGRGGARCLVVERRTTRSLQPRAKLVNVRTMELLRRWGIADDVRERAPLPRDYPSDIVFATRLRGHEIARFANALSTARRPEDPFAEPAQQAPQWVVEEALSVALEDCPSVEVRRNAVLSAIADDGELATCTVLDRERGAEEAIAARWVVGADGARSTVRELCGIAMAELSPPRPNLGLVFRAPGLAGSHRLGPAVHYWLVNADAPAIIGPLDGGDTWWLQATGLSSQDAVDALDVAGLIRRCVGGPVAHEVLARDPWMACCRIAERYRHGRAFLVGDAAHVHPPMGGYGMNMGIGDAVDLGWKLSAVLAGWGDERLLDTYELERRPVHRRVIEEAASNYGLLPGDLVVDGIEDGGPEGARLRDQVGELIRGEKAREFRSLGVQLGTRYRRSPAIVPDGTPEPADPVDRYEPVVRPGHRAPHRWLAPGVALHDRCAPGFALVCRGDQPAAGAWRDEADRRGMPLAVVTLDAEQTGDLYRAPATLVRPDQHVAWCGEPADRAEQVLDAVLGAGPAEARDALATAGRPRRSDTP